jgi:hypothetical protein
MPLLQVDGSRGRDYNQCADALNAAYSATSGYMQYQAAVGTLTVGPGRAVGLGISTLDQLDVSLETGPTGMLVLDLMTSGDGITWHSATLGSGLLVPVGETTACFTTFAEAGVPSPLSPGANLRVDCLIVDGVAANMRVAISGGMW